MNSTFSSSYNDKVKNTPWRILRADSSGFEWIRVDSSGCEFALAIARGLCPTRMKAVRWGLAGGFHPLTQLHPRLGGSARSVGRARLRVGMASHSWERAPAYGSPHSRLDPPPSGGRPIWIFHRSGGGRVSHPYIAPLERMTNAST